MSRVLAEHSAGCQVMIRVVPRSQPAGVGPVRQGRLLVRVGAAPVEGQANREVLKRLARSCGVAPSACTILRGEQGRDKVILVAGRSCAELADALGLG